jgi:hypothetical protein
MAQITADKNMVAYCGLYCGACGKLLKGSCPGCAKNEKASWCTIRTCCIGKKIASCAECTEHKDPMGCKKFNNAFSKIFGLIFRSDRAACVAMIREKGPEQYAQHMAKNGTHTIKK